MGNYLITGVAGTGKTTIINELAKRGYTAYSTDEMPEVTQLENLKTGEFIEKTGAPIDFSRYGWNWQIAGLKELLESADDIFIGASVSNLHDYCKLFDKIIVLTLPENDLRKRLASRDKDDDYGKHPDDLARVLAVMHSEKEQLVEHDDAIEINASQSVEDVTAEILEYINAKS